MRKCKIAITAVLENNNYPTVLLDLSPNGVSVNCPKNAGIEVDSITGDSHFELVFTLPDSDEELHLQCKKRTVSDLANRINVCAA
ncbi:MAG: PilZ domain-containing protein [Candidatus Hermodarchaeia archaeon]|jgi:hypothetical protein